MKVFVINNKDILDIINMSTESSEHLELLKGLIPSTGASMCGYMYNVLSLYLLNYVPLNDATLSIYEHNTIYEQFKDAAGWLDQCDSEIKTVNHIESMLGSGSVDYYGSFCSSMYEDLFQALSDHYVTVYGSRFVNDHHESLSEDLERVAELTKYVAKEIESRYLSYQDVESNSNVLFGMKDSKLVVLVQ